MEYYQVLKSSDQTRFKPEHSDILVAHELYTKREIDKMRLSDSFISKHFTLINLAPKNTYFMFGTRFSKFK